jgi:hypothetical protein
MAIVYSGDNITFGDGSIIAGVATQNNVYNVVTANANTGVGNTTVTFTSNTAAINVGMIIYGGGFGRGATVSSLVNANTLIVSSAAANTATNTRISFIEPNRVVTADVAGPGLCKAWVNFNGAATTTPTLIRAAFNVSSIQDNGTGNYTVNFTTAMPDANYAVTFGVGGGGSGLNSAFVAGVLTTTQYGGASNKTTSAVQFTTGDYTATLRDLGEVYLFIFR